MARIVHIALKVDDLEKATQFYEKSFGFVEVETGQVRDHTSRHLTDGTIDLALIKYDSEDSGLGWKSDAKVEGKATALPTTCKMERPK